MKSRRWQDHLIFIVGVWLVASPWALGSYGSDSLPVGTPAWNFLACGLAVAALGGAAFASFHFWEEWADIAFGCWLTASPWVIGYTEDRLLTWNALISGSSLVILAAWILFDRPSPDAFS